VFDMRLRILGQRLTDRFDRPAADGSAQPPPLLRRVLCPVDFSVASMRAVVVAVHVANAARATLHLLHVVEAPHGHPTTELRVHRAARRLRNLIAATVRARCDVREVVSVGVPVDELVVLARARDVDLVVLAPPPGSERHEWNAVERLMTAVRCPVLLVPPGGPLAASTLALEPPPDGVPA
jgi:nucleotide-binding universal stress UspA family protein